ncbi:hypothetical protein KY289_001393 [Solanum tuberosum]|nr:hypothetical protein KY289_001393 [Solanum tuberosum]
MTSKCKRYFNLYRTTENEKLEANALYLNGLAEIWYPSLVLSRGVVTWTNFKEELCDRFDAEHLDDIMEEFKWLEQTESVDMFLGKFEDLKAQMLVRNQPLIESHFVSSFMGGLKENIRFDVKIFKFTSFRFAIEQARMQERAIEATL